MSVAPTDVGRSNRPRLIILGHGSLHLGSACLALIVMTLEKSDQVDGVVEGESVLCASSGARIVVAELDHDSILGQFF